MHTYVVIVAVNDKELSFHISGEDVEVELKKIISVRPSYVAIQSQLATASKSLISIAKVRCAGTKPSQLKRVVARTTALNILLKAA